MKSKFLSLIGIVVLLTMLIGVLPVSAAPATPDYKPVDVGPKLRELGPSSVPIKSDKFLPGGDSSEGGETVAAAAAAVGDIKLGLWQGPDGLYLDLYEVRAIGDEIEVWVNLNLDYPEGDPRNPVIITQEQIDYLVSEFDNNIFPKMEDFFGPADVHDGSGAPLSGYCGVLGLPAEYCDYSSSENRVIAMISNIGDESYLDPTYPNYIAGFYWGLFEFYFNRNIISIDSHDWANRIGPDARRPYLYEGIIAHEYQHLLHDDYDPNEENWINEGLADYAMVLCGYASAASHLEDLINYPENSLVAWEDQGGLEILADYGIAYLFQEYLVQLYGEEFVQAEFQDGVNQGIASIDALLGLGSFADLYHDFAVGMYTKGFFEAEYLADFQLDVGPPGKPNPQAYNTAGAPPWGSDYIALNGFESIANLKFNGYQFNPVPWTTDGDVLWSGTGDLIDNFAIFEVSVPSGAPVLAFDTLVDIEDYWDFGFVQISTDGGYTWTSLENEYTTSDHDSGAHPNIIAQLPGLTGWSGGWINMSFDLSTFAGQDVLLAFRYMTDWSFTYEGWFIDNIYIDGMLISDGSSTDNIFGLNEILGISNDYTVQLIGEKIRKGKPVYEVQTLFSGGYLSDWESIRQMFDNYRTVVMVVTYDAPQGVTSYADYSFEIDHRGGKHLK